MTAEELKWLREKELRDNIPNDESLYWKEAEAAGMSVKACKAFKALARSGKRLLPDGDWVGFISGIEWEHGSRVPTQIRLMVGGEPIRYDLHVEQPEPVLTFKSNIFKK
jgi:hypothetical protein